MTKSLDDTLRANAHAMDDGGHSIATRRNSSEWRQTYSVRRAIADGLSLHLCVTFTIMDPQTKHPGTKEWERAFRIFDLLL
jgi:hypothetical protein